MHDNIQLNKLAFCSTMLCFTELNLRNVRKAESISQLHMFQSSTPYICKACIWNKGLTLVETLESGQLSTSSYSYSSSNVTIKTILNEGVGKKLWEVLRQEERVSSLPGEFRSHQHAEHPTFYLASLEEKKGQKLVGLSVNVQNGPREKEVKVKVELLTTNTALLRNAQTKPFST